MRLHHGFLLLLMTTTTAGCTSTSAQGAAAVTSTATAVTVPTPVTAADAPTRAAPSPLRAVFLGDSYTVGFGSDDGGYVPDVAAQLGWQATALGQTGTGYVAPSPTPGQAPYGARVAAVVALDPDVVVVQGSTNDFYVVDQVDAAAQAVFAELARELPGTPVVVVGPVMPQNSDASLLTGVRNAVADAAGRSGLPFIDPIGAQWLEPTDGLYSIDGIHPNDAGYAEFADDLVGALRGLGF